MAKILVIDDDGIVRDALTAFLSHSGHQVICASDGGNGVLAYRNNLPDLVILDRDLPVLTGSGVFKKIREISMKTPIIILSGYDAPEDAEAYLRDGAASFLSKGDGLYGVLDEVNRTLGVKTPAQEPAAAPWTAAPPAKPPAASSLVVVADDDSGVADVLLRALTSLGCEAVRAEDGVKAVELIRARKPVMALLDISMPKKTGVQVLRELVQEMPDTDFMMITGNDDEEVARDCLRLGAFDYIPKPVNIAVFKNIIKARLVVKHTGV